mmetsp:Transcript_4407/g.7593  ORF Transcript_4407/g.7593 Transcript_4407/m.7593 type:complete len:771 (-) Transcript_4407:203-2515(-)
MVDPRRHDSTQRKDRDTQGKESWRVSKEEAAFILGKGGQTKAKLATVSGAQLDLTEIKGRGAEPGSHKLDISGTTEQRERATKYVGFVTAQRLGPVSIDEPAEHDDLTILDVPADAVSFIMGKQRSFLRIVEEEWGTLLFFLEVDPKNPLQYADPARVERLAIFGPVRARRGAELKVLAAIAMKHSGHYAGFTDVGDTCSEEVGFATDTLVIQDEDFSYALGKNGSTRKKLAQASHCIVEYVGHVAYFSGTKQERSRAREYFCWLLQQRSGCETIVDHQGRDDVTLMMVPRNLLGYVNGAKGATLREIEMSTNTFCFIQRGLPDNEEQRPLLIFGRAEDRNAAEIQIWDKISQRYEARQGEEELPREGMQVHQDLADQMMMPLPCQVPRMAAVWVPVQPQPVEAVPPSGKLMGEMLPMAEILQFMPEDFSFILSQIPRISAVSGSSLERWQTSFQLKCTGSYEERRLAQVAITLLLAQHKGRWTYDTLQRCCDHLTSIQAPAGLVGQLAAKQGIPLSKQIEDDFDVLVFVLPLATFTPGVAGDQVIVLGEQRMQRAAELRILQRMEMRRPGLFTGNVRAPVFSDSPGFGTDIILVGDEDQSYSLGRGGQTLRKISRAAGSIIEYVGPYAFLAGTMMERRHAYEYMGWLLQQRVGAVTVWNKEQRDDCTVVRVPKDCVGFVTGQKGVSLHAVEEATFTFCFIEGERDDPAIDPKPLLVFGSYDGRMKAQEAVMHMINQKLEAGKCGSHGLGWTALLPNSRGHDNGEPGTSN